MYFLFIYSCKSQPSQYIGFKYNFPKTFGLELLGTTELLLNYEIPEYLEINLDTIDKKLIVSSKYLLTLGYRNFSLFAK